MNNTHDITENNTRDYDAESGIHYISLLLNNCIWCYINSMSQILRDVSEGLACVSIVTAFQLLIQGCRLLF